MDIFSDLGVEILLNVSGLSSLVFIVSLAFHNHDNCCFSWLSCISSLSISPNYSPVLSAVEDVNRVRCDYNAHQLLCLYPFMLGHK